MALSFGTSGVRGLVTEFTDQQVYLLVSAFLKYADSLKISKAVATGCDLRESSPNMQKAVHQAIADHSKVILNCGSVPTPCLAYYAQENSALAIMVTGSHIPADRNGLKFYLESGETLKHDDQAIFSLYQKMNEEQYGRGSFDGLGRLKSLSPVSLKDVSSECERRFKERYTGFFKEFDLSSLKVLFYQHSSVARDLIPAILENLGAKVIRVGRSDKFVPVDTEAVDSLSQFQKWLVEHGADVLVSTDGDGDRPLVVDGKGQIIQGDKLGMMTSLFLSIEAVALPISCNSGISEIKEIEKVVFTKIGSPFVVEALDELSKKFTKVAGFEANGGFILKSSISRKNQVLSSLPTRDSVLPIVTLLAISTMQNIKPSEAVERLPKKYTASVLIKNCSVDISKKILEKVKSDVRTVLFEILSSESDPKEINELDGVRINLKNRDVIHFRPSGNAPEFRCYVESNSQAEAERIADCAKKYLVSYTI